MLTLTSSVHIEAEPKAVFEWFRHLEENYPRWHPDHESAAWEGEPLEVGSILVSRERLHGKEHVLRARLTRVIPDRLVEFEHAGPMSLLSPGGSFEAHPHPDGGCDFTARLDFRAANLLLRLVPQRVEALKIHMEEEGANLKRLLE